MNIKRAYYIFKCRTHVLTSHLLERVLHTLSKWGLIVEHKESYTNIIDDGKPQTAPDIQTERFVFGVSYIIRKVEFISQYWFETKRGKRIFTVYANHHLEQRVCYRAELKSFFAHFSHKQRMWIHRSAPVVYIHSAEMVDFNKPQQDPFAPVGFKTHQCDFSRCRYAFEFSISTDTLNTSAEEVIAESYRVLRSGLNEKVVEINTVLTGAENDGAMTSPKGMPLSENRLCYKCGLPVFASAKDKYKFECLNHGELSVEDIRRVDPVTYEETMKYCRDYLEALIKKSCPQDSNL